MGVVEAGEGHDMAGMPASFHGAFYTLLSWAGGGPQRGSTCFLCLLSSLSSLSLWGEERNRQHLPISWLGWRRGEATESWLEAGV